MTAPAKAPALSDESVLRLVRDAGRDGTTLALLAEDLDVPASSMTLRMVVSSLERQGRVRRPSGDNLRVLAVRR